MAIGTGRHCGKRDGAVGVSKETISNGVVVEGAGVHADTAGAGRVIEIGAVSSVVIGLNIVNMDVPLGGNSQASAGCAGDADVVDGHIADPVDDGKRHAESVTPASL